MNTTPTKENMKQITDGTELNLAAFGRAVVRRLYVHPETKELVADVKSYGGDLLHLSLAYCQKVAI